MTVELIAGFLLFISGAVIVYWIWKFPVKVDNQPDIKLTQSDQPIKNKKSQLQPQDVNIRRFAKVDGDDYATYYEPILSCTAPYTALTGTTKDTDRLYSLCSKALRKRWSIIFHNENDENNAVEATFWTYSIFCSILIRHTIRALNNHTFTHNNKIINPLLFTIDELGQCNIQKCGSIKDYPIQTVNIHMIDKLLPPFVMELLTEKQAYPYMVNAVTGYYLNKSHPYYALIEQVEVHVLGDSSSDWFDTALKNVLFLIESNTILKNTPEASVFDSVYSLLIDRFLLWEMFKVYQVSENPVLGKSQFEAILKERLDLRGDADKYTYEIKMTVKSEESISFLVGNVIALPYSKILYSYSKRIAANKIINEREIVPNDIAVTENSEDDPAEESSPEQLKSGNDDISVESLFKKEK